MHHKQLEHRFVQYIPEELAPGVFYISMEFATAAHSCCCGCGLQVVTPFTPTDWRLTFDGETVSVWPSIGNWNFPCRSHYIIRHSRIIGVGSWKDERIERGRLEDKQSKEDFYEARSSSLESQKLPKKGATERSDLWCRIKKKVRRI